MKPRIYELDRREINSSSCSGFLHKARRNVGYSCMACDRKIEVGDEYVILNIFSCSDPLCKECFIGDHPEDCIVGVKIEKGRMFGIPRTYVICKDLSKEVK